MIVEGGNGVLVCDARSNDFSPSRVTGHEMGLDQARHNLQVSFDKAFIDLHWGAFAGGADKDMVFVFFRKVIRNFNIL